MDLLFVGLTLALCAASLGLVKLCDVLRGEK
jgi:hypothetical protein